MRDLALAADCGVLAERLIQVQSRIDHVTGNGLLWDTFQDAIDALEDLADELEELP